MTEYTERERQELEDVADQLAALCRRMEISGVKGLESMETGAPLPRTQEALGTVLYLIDRDWCDVLFIRMRRHGATLRQAQQHDNWLN